MAHKISQSDQWFLTMGCHDPLTGNEFAFGDNVVACRKCRCVQLADSWVFNENKCIQCNNNVYVDDFSRSFIDISYHRSVSSSGGRAGFRIVESDKIFGKDKRLISTLNKVWNYMLVITIAGLIVMIGILYYYEQPDFLSFMQELLSHQAEKVSRELEYVIEQISSLFIYMVDEKLTVLWDKVCSIWDKLRDLFDMVLSWLDSIR